MAFVAFAFSFNAQVSYTGKPMYKIAVKRAGIAIGNITVELFPNIAYHHTRNFDSLAQVGFYDTTAFHRVIPGFMIQGGDPNSRHGAVSTWGFGQPGQPTVNAEFSAAKHLRGILSAARSSNINSATSQFFICVAPYPSLDGQYSIYGRVIAGMDVVDTIVMAPRNAQNRPNLKHEMFVNYLGSDDTIPVAPLLMFPKKDSMDVDTTSQILLKWKTVSDGIIYELNIASDSLFNNILINTKTGNQAYYFGGSLPGNTKYYWRVRTNNGGHFSPYSTVWYFKTQMGGIYTGLNKTASNKQVLVFPNPSEGSFTFEQLLPGSRLTVFDSSGKNVFDEVMKDERFYLNLSNKSKGTYFYTVSLIGSSISVGKLMLR